MYSIQIRLTKTLLERAQDLVDEDLYSNKSEVIRDGLRQLTDKKRFDVLFASDLHGNKVQYTKLFNYAEKIKAGAIILGGDLTPKDKAHRTINDQKDFITNFLLKAISKFKKKNPDCRIYLLLGNDDFKTNHKILEENQHFGYEYIHNKLTHLYEDFMIAGYTYVPLTPFQYKDWEKLDLTEGDENKTRTGFLLQGKKLEGTKFVEAEFDLKNRIDTIEKDLNILLKKADARKLVLVTHSPPYNTCLDHSYHGHVGSTAIRKFIDEKKPLITLHGHIHENVILSGSFKQMIGPTVSMNPGNNHISERLTVIRFNLYGPDRAVRIVI